MFDFYDFLQPATLNGHALPDDFRNLTIVNGVAISGDGRRYAYIDECDRVRIAEVPASGRFQVSGQAVEVRRNADGSGHRASATPITD